VQAGRFPAQILQLQTDNFATPKSAEKC
jgi:hypothetical protein